MPHDIGAQFRALHRPGDPFILANAWDIGSAKMLSALGAKAIATSSAAHAFTLGRPDLGTVTRDEALAHAQDLVSAVAVPVQGDFENGFGTAPEVCAETVHLSAEIGLAGICIEDIDLPGSTPYDFDLSVERIRAAVSAARSLSQDFVLTARADGVMHRQYDLSEAIRRVQAFAEVGADCVYVPVPPDLDGLAALCRAVSAPVNALAAGPFTKITLSDFAKSGVARISLGSSLARVTHRAIQDCALAMFEQGDFSGLSTGLTSRDVDPLLADPE